MKPRPTAPPRHSSLWGRTFCPESRVLLAPRRLWAWPGMWDTRRWSVHSMVFRGRGEPEQTSLHSHGMFSAGTTRWRGLGPQPATFPVWRAWLGHRCLGKAARLPQPYCAPCHMCAFYPWPLPGTQRAGCSCPRQPGANPHCQGHGVIPFKCTHFSPAPVPTSSCGGCCELLPGAAL